MMICWSGGLGRGLRGCFDETGEHCVGFEDGMVSLCDRRLDEIRSWV